VDAQAWLIYLSPNLLYASKNENTEFHTIKAPSTGKLVAAVYGFTDKTGQRKPSDKMANISTAVTQGAEVWLIKALQEVGNGEWFQVVERVGLDNLTKERQIIRQARESVGDDRQLKPMLFAGVIIEGGIIGYDSNVLTGGAGVRYLGSGSKHTVSPGCSYSNNAYDQHTNRRSVVKCNR
jgi:curli production assembly/transport component CsgG